MEEIMQRFTKFYYLYKHTRIDTNEVFYIGIGTSLHPSSPTQGQKYSRAYTKINRSKWWKSIVAKTNYTIQILLESNDYNFIKEKEKEAINFYGRRDIQEGTLVNLTDGGEGTINRVYSMSEETKLRLSNIRSIIIYCYSSKGVFLRTYKGIEEASKLLGIYKNNISSAFKYSGYTKGYYFFKEYKGENLGYEYDPSKPHTNSRKVECYKNGNYITTYNSISEAANDLFVSRESLRNSLKRENGTCQGYHFKYL